MAVAQRVRQGNRLVAGDIKFVGISHFHGDHTGQLPSFSKALLLICKNEWDGINANPPATGANVKAFEGWMKGENKVEPQEMDKDVFEDGSVIVLRTPGHTPGTMSFTFQVLDKGKPMNVAYSGGTAFNFNNRTPDPGIKNFQIYIDSQRKFAANAAATGATVLISNHSEFDIADTKNKMLAARGNGPHPYEQGADAVQRYFKVMQGCARAAQLKLEQRQAAGEK